MLTFPCFKYLTWRPRYVGQVQTGGQATNGQVQTAKTDGGGRWVFDLGDANLNKRIDLKAWRAFEMILEGGVTEVILELCDRRQMPNYVAGDSAGIPHSDDALFSDDTGYSNGAASPVYSTSGGALRAVSMTIDAPAGIEGGEHFSILHPTAGWRLYRIATIIDNVITFRPPLREATPAGVQLEFEVPRCVVRLLDAENYAPTVERLRYSRASASFVESFDYAY